jgi:hypothetical protein
MDARPGDRIIVQAPHYRLCEVIEARGPDGSPPFLVRWDDDGGEALFFPGPQAVIEPRDVQHELADHLSRRERR